MLFKIFDLLTRNKGKRFEKSVSDYLGRKVIIENRGKIYSYGDKAKYTEIDIETPSTAIEVKSGKGSGLKKQLDRYSKVTQKEPVALAPNMKYGAKYQTRKYYKVFDSKKELRDYLLSKGDSKKRRRN